MIPFFVNDNNQFYQFRYILLLQNELPVCCNENCYESGEMEKILFITFTIVFFFTLFLFIYDLQNEQTGFSNRNKRKG